MRERQQLESRIATIERMEREIADQTGLIELGEAEGDAAIVAEAGKRNIDITIFGNDISRAS